MGSLTFGTPHWDQLLANIEATSRKWIKEIPKQMMDQAMAIINDLLPTLPPAAYDIETILGYFGDWENSLKQAIYNSHLSDILNGGYGLNPDDEDALWQREREREEAIAQSSVEEVKRNFSMSGFSIPTGAMMKAMDRAIGMSLVKNSSVNRDISVKRADLYWEGKKFALTSGLEYEKLLVQEISELAKVHTALNQVTIETRARVLASALSMMNLSSSVASHFNTQESEQVSAHDSTNNSSQTSESVSTNLNHNF